MKTKFVQDIKGLLDDIMTEYAVLKEAMELANKPPDNWVNWKRMSKN